MIHTKPTTSRLPKGFAQRVLPHAANDIVVAALRTLGPARYSDITPAGHLILGWRDPAATTTEAGHLLFGTLEALADHFAWTIPEQTRIKAEMDASTALIPSTITAPKEKRGRFLFRLPSQNRDAAFHFCADNRWNTFWTFRNKLAKRLEDWCALMQEAIQLRDPASSPKERELAIMSLPGRPDWVGEDPDCVRYPEHQALSPYATTTTRPRGQSKRQETGRRTTIGNARSPHDRGREAPLSSRSPQRGAQQNLPLGTGNTARPRSPAPAPREARPAAPQRRAAHPHAARPQAPRMTNGEKLLDLAQWFSAPA